MRAAGTERALAVPQGGIELWPMRLAVPAGEADRLLLDPAERERADRRVHAQDRERFIGAHAFTRRVLAHYAGRAPQELCIHAESGGKPRLAPGQAPGLHWNLSHSGDHALVAVACGPVGVDIEVDRSFDQLEALARRCLTAGEFDAWQGVDNERRGAAFLRTWTRKEAVLKCVGAGVAIAPATVATGLGPGTTIVDLEWEGRAHQVAVRSLESVGGLWVALACAGPLGPWALDDGPALRWRRLDDPAAGDAVQSGGSGARSAPSSGP